MLGILLRCIYVFYIFGCIDGDELINVGKFSMSRYFVISRTPVVQKRVQPKILFLDSVFENDL